MMKKLIIGLAAAAAIMAGSYKAGAIVQDRSYTERIVVRIVDLNSGYNCMEGKNIVSGTDVVEIDKIPGAKLGDRVQVNFKGDLVASTKLLK